MDNQVEQIKQKLNIVDVINRYVPLKKRGRNHVACCPFHGEKTPSFTVSEELQIFKCFGCGKSGDIFTFLQEYERIDFREALTELAAQAGIVLKKTEFTSAKDKQKSLLLDINSHLAKFYQYLLLTHPLGQSARDYLANRGLTSNTIKQFSLGFSPENPQLAVNYLTKKGYRIADLIATGTFGQSQYNRRLYDRFQGRLIFPLSDYRGRILGFSGRLLPTSKNQNSGKYINSPETEIYHKSRHLFGLHLSKDSIRSLNAAIVVEGEFDLISPFQFGITNIVAIKGTAFTEDQLQLLRRYTDTLILALDSDFAGSNAARKSIELADAMEFDIKVLILGDKYKDPDEAVRGDLKFFKSQVSAAVPIWDFIIQSQLKLNNPETIKGKKEILAVTLPFLVKIKNSVIRSDYFQKLANEIGSDLEAVIEESKKYAATASSATPSTPVTTPDTSPTDASKTVKFEDQLLHLIVGAKNPVKLANKLSPQLSRFQDTRFHTIGQALLTASKFDPQAFTANLPAEIRPIFQSIYLDTTVNSLESRTRLREVKKTVALLDNFYLKDRLKYLSLQIAKYESDPNNPKLAAAETEYNQLLSQLSRVQVKKS
ncbi:MAG TPA: DNA primase [Candidatus Woesebacteria bacterium]|nr:DNA primase [Candidatus Woesebacteria bacterium]